MTSRKIAALRALAERPGTPQEGAVAREMLRRHEEKLQDQSPEDAFRSFLRRGMSSVDFVDVLHRHYGPKMTCACGAPLADTCVNLAEHLRIMDEIQRRFPLGATVFYNCHGHNANSRGVVVSHSAKRWNYVRIKFEHLKWALNVPIYDADGWHLSTVPVEDEALIHRLTNGYRGRKKSC